MRFCKFAVWSLSKCAFFDLTVVLRENLWISHKGLWFGLNFSGVLYGPMTFNSRVPGTAMMSSPACLSVTMEID